MAEKISINYGGALLHIDAEAIDLARTKGGSVLVRR
jgi:hypothetical protein